MTETTVTEAGGWCAPIAAELRRIADALADVEHEELPEPRVVYLHLQPGGKSDDEIIAAVDTLGLVLGGKTGSAERMTKDGIYHYSVEVLCGPVNFKVYREISAGCAVQVSEEARAEMLAAKESELAVLRAEVTKLRAAAALTPDDLSPERHAEDCPGADGGPCICPESVE